MPFMSKFFQQGVLLLLPVLIIGCSNTKEKPANSVDSVTQQSPIQLTPNTTNSCKAPLQVVAEWNLAKIDPTAKAVSIYITSVDGISEKLFAEGGSSGRVETGKWVYAEKTKFILKDKLSKKVFGESFVKGPGC
jgi:hypothetical protein